MADGIQALLELVELAAVELVQIVELEVLELLTQEVVVVHPKEEALQELVEK